MSEPVTLLFISKTVGVILVFTAIAIFLVKQRTNKIKKDS